MCMNRKIITNPNAKSYNYPVRAEASRYSDSYILEIMEVANGLSKALNGKGIVEAYDDPDLLDPNYVRMLLEERD